jgi:hypothetical protein
MRGKEKESWRMENGRFGFAGGWSDCGVEVYTRVVYPATF